MDLKPETPVLFTKNWKFGERIFPEEIKGVFLYYVSLGLGQFTGRIKYFCGDKEMSIFVPKTEITDLTPDEDATPEELVLLDRVIEILNELGDKDMPEDMKKEWRKIADTFGDITLTPQKLYGTTFIHKGWEIILHGRKILSRRFED